MRKDHHAMTDRSPKEQKKEKKGGEKWQIRFVHLRKDMSSNLGFPMDIP